MILKYFKAVSSTDGTKGTEIKSGELNSLFDTYTKQQQLNGATKYRKMYIESDIDITVNVGISSIGDYDSLLVISTGDAEVGAGIDPKATKYGAEIIISSTVNSLTFLSTRSGYDVLRASEDFIYNGDIYAITSIIAGSTDEMVVSFIPSMTTPPKVGETVTSFIPISLVANIAVPFWRMNYYPAFFQSAKQYNNTDIITLV